MSLQKINVIGKLNIDLLKPSQKLNFTPSQSTDRFMRNAKQVEQLASNRQSAGLKYSMKHDINTDQESLFPLRV